MKPHLASAFLILFLGGCKEQPAASAEPPAKPLIGDFTEAILPEIGYKRITDRSGNSIQGGDKYPDPSIGLDPAHTPLAVHWAGIKSLDPIPGKGNDTFYRYKFIAELYPDAESARRRAEGFEANFRDQLKASRGSETKRFFPVTHFAHDRVFYLLATDMSASIDDNEAGRIKWALLRQLTD